jgi:hypothetical protein
MFPLVAGYGDSPTAAAATAQLGVPLMSRMIFRPAAKFVLTHVSRTPGLRLFFVVGSIPLQFW